MPDYCHRCGEPLSIVHSCLSREVIAERAAMERRNQTSRGPQGGIRVHTDEDERAWRAVWSEIEEQEASDAADD